MAELIANDWRAINARMQQIKPENSGAIPQSCPKCYNIGWTADVYGYRGYRVSDRCHNPEAAAEASARVAMRHADEWTDANRNSV